MEAGEVLGHHLGRAPVLLGLGEDGFLLLGAALQPALAVADAEVVVPSLADLDRPVREVCIDADLVDDRVVAEPEFQFRVMFAAGGGVVDAVDPGQLGLGLVFHSVEQRHPVDGLVAEGADEPLARQKLFHGWLRRLGQGFG